MPVSHIALGVFVALIWAASFIFIRFALDVGLSPVLLVALRFLAVSLLAPFIPRPFGWPVLVALGIATGMGQMGLATVSEAVGLPPGMASLVTQIQVVFTMGLALLFLKEQPSGRQLVGALLAGAGIALLVIDRSAAQDIPLIGLAIALMGAMLWAVGNIILRHQGRNASPVAIAVWVSTIAGPPMLAISWALEGSPVRTLGTLRDVPTAIASVLFLAAFTTLAATVIWSWLLARHTASKVASLSLLVPVFGMSLATITLGEKFAWVELVSAVLVVGGLGLSVAPQPPSAAIARSPTS